jgi:hypothetical protein
MWQPSGPTQRELERESQRLKRIVADMVGRGDLLQAQQRLGHRDTSTTLRNCAHALPLDDQSIADAIDEMLGAQTQPMSEASFLSE